MQSVQRGFRQLCLAVTGWADCDSLHVTLHPGPYYVHTILFHHRSRRLVGALVKNKLSHEMCTSHHNLTEITGASGTSWPVQPPN